MGEARTLVRLRTLLAGRELSQARVLHGQLRGRLRAGVQRLPRRQAEGIEPAGDTLLLGDG